MDTFLLVDQEVHVSVDGDNDNIGENVSAANKHQGIGVFHWDPLGDLHHPKDDDQVGSVQVSSVVCFVRMGGVCSHICGLIAIVIV